jgi:hypothetical protein
MGRCNNRRAPWSARATALTPDLELRTLGHATLLVLEDGQPLIATDPWLVGSVYWRSWWLEKYPEAEELDLIATTRYIYITHSHPDHLHPPTLRRLGRPHTLHPAFPHYPVPDYLRSHGFPVSILEPCQPYSLSPYVTIVSIPTFLGDSILIIDTPSATIFNLNDTNPPIRLLRLLRDQYQNPAKLRVVLKSYSPASAAVATYRNGVRAPLRDKRAYVVKAQELAESLAATHFVPFASQAFFSRADSRWANEHKVVYEDLLNYWEAKSVELCPPFVRMDLRNGTHTTSYDKVNRELDYERLAKVVQREHEEEDFVLPNDFSEKLRTYLSSFWFLRILFRHGIGFKLSTSSTEWFYDVRKTVRAGIPREVDIVLTLPDKVLYEALSNGNLTDLGITMFIRVDSAVDVRRAYAAFSLMGLRDYGNFAGARSFFTMVSFYLPFVFPQILRVRWKRRNPLKKTAAHLPSPSNLPPPHLQNGEDWPAFDPDDPHTQ